MMDLPAEVHRLRTDVIDAARELVQCPPCMDADCCDKAIAYTRAFYRLEDAIKAWDDFCEQVGRGEWGRVEAPKITADV